MGTDQSDCCAWITSLASAALGYGLLWLVLEGGKLVFGKKKIRLEKPTPFTWTRKEDDADFVVGEERGLWSDYFAREKDLLLLQCNEAAIDGRSFGNTTLRFNYNIAHDRGRRIRPKQDRSNLRRSARTADPA